MVGNDGVLAEFERAIDLRKDQDVFADDLVVAKSLFDRRREVNEYKAGAQYLGGFLDLREAMHGRRIAAR